jgi:holliday junction DNA helicase RuvA
MIAALTGQLRRKAIDYLIVNVAGIGYQVYLPLSTYHGLPEEGEEVSLHIHTHLREDSLSLFGFLTAAEKDMFQLLMAVSGIGPKLALAVLSSFSVRDLAQAIQSSDDSKLCSIPGIGKKTAARMVLELKDRIKVLEPYLPSHTATPGMPADVNDAVSALVNLGYKRTIAEEALNRIRGNRSDLTLEELIREGLNVLIKR